MICYVCEKDTWESLGTFQPSPEDTTRELRICRDCGNVAYKVEPIEEKKLKDFYRKDYRGMPNFTNFLTTTNKLNYITSFLSDFLKDKKGLVVGDVGCATGYLLYWMRQNGHRATGSEWTVTYRRFCEHFYGIPITEDLETKHKYDLIVMYHTFEHMVEPDKKLKHYVSLLSENGRIMISCPEWLDTLEEASGQEMKSFEHLFHTNHINLFTNQSMKNVIAKCGLEIEKENHITYGQTYLLKKAEKPLPIIKEKWQEQLKKIRKTQVAIAFYQQGKFQEAIKEWPKFPEAYVAQVQRLYTKDPSRQRDIFEEAKKLLEDSPRVHHAAAQWLYQYDNWKGALELLYWVLEHKPTPPIYVLIAYCLSHLGDHKKAMIFMQKSAELDPRQWADNMNWVCHEAASIPAWDEVAMQKFSQAYLNQNRDKIKTSPNDPVMEIKANGKEKEEKSPQTV